MALIAPPPSRVAVPAAMPTTLPSWARPGSESRSDPDADADNPFDTLALALVRKLGIATSTRNAAAMLGESHAQAGRVLLVSSARAGEGKSFVVAMLARRFARILGRQVAVVDANSAHPSVHACFQAQPIGRGLFDCLDTGALIEEALQPSAARDVLVMPTLPGVRQSTLSRLNAMHKVLDGLRDRYALTLVDGGPLTRAGCLPQVADATLLVVDASRTRRDVVKGMLDNSQIERTRLAGVVLNRQPEYVPRWLYRRFR